ncbi:MAG: universal stress protein [Chloroflexi bacterium]|nr:universal stress protein [Chloroflexota bacterium]
MYEKILVTLDGSLLAEEVVPHVVDMATRMASEVILLRVSPPVQAIFEDGVSMVTIPKDEVMNQTAVDYKEYLNRVADRLRAAGISKVQVAVQFGDPAEQIVDYAAAHGVDVIAMSTHGRTGISRWVYGSVANRVLQAAPVPILLIRSKG